MKEISLTLLFGFLCTLMWAQNTALLSKSVDELRKDAAMKHASLSVSVWSAVGARSTLLPSARLLSNGPSVQV